MTDKITGETSDGYHTFNELYEFRKLFNAALFNEWHFYEQQYAGAIKPHKSTRRRNNDEPKEMEMIMSDLGNLLKRAAKPKWWQFRKRKLHKRATNQATPTKNEPES